VSSRNDLPEFLPPTARAAPRLKKASPARMALVCGGLLAVGCRALLGLDEEAPPELPDDRWWPTRQDEGLPYRPAGFEAVDDGNYTDAIYLALTQLRIGAPQSPAENAPWKTIGFNLDGDCSAPTCSTLVKEGAACRDNAIGQFMEFVTRFVPDLTEQNLNCELEVGGFNVILKVSRYNGLPDDTEVRVDVYSSARRGDEPVPCDKEPHSPGALWRATDAWIVAEESIAEDAAPPAGPFQLPDSKWASVDAFVHKGYLIARFERVQLWLRGERNIPGFRNVLSNVVAAGKLAQDPDANGSRYPWKLEHAVLGGVTDVDTMMSAFAEIGVTREDCEAGTVGIRRALDAARDMTVDGTCMLSMGLTFEAKQLGGAEVDLRGLPPTIGWDVCRAPEAAAR
jgi:hypothetical protein